MNILRRLTLPKRPSILLGVYLFSLIGQLSRLSDGEEQADEPPKMPNIWGKSGDGTGGDGSLRVLSEIRLVDGRGSFLAEEMVDGSNRLYRFDVLRLGSGGRAPGQRRSIIVDGSRGEAHFFEPFKCYPLDVLQGDALFGLFPRKHPFVKSGLGSIWLLALDAQDDTEFKAAVESAWTAPADSTSSTGEGSAPIVDQALANFDSFTVEPHPDYPYRIEMFFVPQASADEDSNKPTRLAAIHLIDRQTDRLKLTARVIEIITKHGAAAKLAEQNDLFELPLGYGCERANQSTYGSRYKFQPPPDCFDGANGQLDEGSSRVCTVHATVTLPDEDANHDMHKWRMLTSSLRLVTGRLAGRPFVVQEVRKFAQLDEGELSELPAGRRKSVLSRSKRVWALGNEAAGEHSVFYELDAKLQACKSFTRSARFREMPVIEVPIWISPTPVGEATRAKGGLSLDSSLMRELFLDTQNFHRIREHEAMLLIYSSFVEEKRIERLELHDSSTGQLLWTGPASVVRKFYTIKHQKASLTDNISDPANEPSPPEPLELQVDISLLTSEADKILAQIHLRLLPSLRLDAAYLHRELDITPCLQAPHDKALGSRLNNSPLLGASEGPGSLSFALTYPLDCDEQTAESIGQMEEELYSQFLDRLLLMGAEVLQVSEIQVNAGYHLIEISATLSKWPELFDFQVTAGMQFSKAFRSVSGRLLTRELKPSELECAESCSHFNCSPFVYCATSNICYMAANANSTPTLEHAPGCNLWTRRTVGPGHHKLKHATPAALFGRLRDAIASESSEPCPLALKLTPLGQSQEFQLVPNAIQLKDSRRQYDSLMLADDSSKASTEQAEIDEPNDPLDQSGQFVASEFEIVFEGRKLSKPQEATGAGQAQIEEATLSFEDCELLCRENDCNSFAHCQVEQSCLISRLSQQAAIEAQSEEEEYCSIMARAKLSKFHRISGVAAPPGATDGGAAAKVGEGPLIKFAEGAGSARDCATECLADPVDHERACKSFYFCPESSHACLLMADRQGQATEQTATEQTAPTCDLYQRSYLVEFNRMPARQLALAPDFRASASIKLLVGLDAEGCASECAQLQADCLAFHVCALGARRGRRRLRCTLLTIATEGAEVAPAARLRSGLDDGSLLRDSQSCSTFVARRLGGQATSELAEPTGGAEGEAGDVKPARGTGRGWMGGLWWVASSLLLGYALAWLVARQDWRASLALRRVRNWQVDRQVLEAH